MASISDSSILEPSSPLGCVVCELDDAQHLASLRVRGQLCALSAPGHARQLDELVGRGYVRLRIELDELSLCTSDGLDLWDDLQHRLDPLDGRLVLAGATGVVRRVLEVVTGPDRHFCPTVEPATRPAG